MWALNKIPLAISFIALSQGTPATSDLTALFQACDKGFDAPELSIPACSVIIREKPPTSIIPNAYINRGHGWKARGNLSEAIKDYTSAIEGDISNDRAFGERGFAWQEKGDQDKAIDDLTQAISINSNNPKWYYGRAIAYSNKTDDELAISDLNEAIRLESKFWIAYAMRAVIYHNKGNIQRALDDLKVVIDNNPNASAYLVQRTRLYLDSGNYQAAIADVNRAININNADLSARSLRADTLRRLGQKDQARSEAEYVLKKDRNNCEALLTEAKLFYESLQIDKAVDTISRCLTNKPTDILGLIWRGRFYLQQRQFARALIDANKANSLYPNTPAVLVIKGRAEGEEGQIDQARASLQLAQKIDRTYIASGLELAKIEFKDRNYKSAIDIITDLLSQKPVTNFEELENVKSEAQKLLELSRIALQRNYASAENRVALVIGNDQYQNVRPLISAGYDAEDVGKTLKKFGFRVTIIRDASKQETVNSLEEFASVSKEADWAFIYYAGHGIEINGENYIVPVDAKFNTDADVANEGVAVNSLLRAASNAKKLRFVVLDACRNNPFLHSMKRLISSQKAEGGLSRIEPDAGTLVFLAAKQGEVAYDAVKPGLHSPFSEAFLRRLKEDDLEVRKFVGLVTDDVLAATSDRQRPYTFGSLSGRQDYFFK